MQKLLHVHTMICLKGTALLEDGSVLSSETVEEKHTIKSCIRTFQRTVNSDTMK